MVVGAFWLVVVVGVATYLGIAGRSTAVAPLVGNLGMIAGLIFATVACLRAARRSAASHRAWVLMAVATGFPALSVLFYGVTILAGASPVDPAGGRITPPPALEIFNLVGYLVPLMAALFMFPRRPQERISRWRMVLDALVITTGLVVISQATILHDVFNAADLGTVSGLVRLIYPVADLAICAVVLTLGMRQDPANRLVWLCVGGGAVVLAVTDSSYVLLLSRGYLTASELTASPLVTGWMAASVLFGLSTLLPTEAPTHRPRNFAVLTQLVPYAPVLGAYGILFVKFAQDDILLLAGEVFLLVLVMVRQVMIVVENVSLTGNLEDKVEVRTAELASMGSIVTSSSDAIVGLSNDQVITTWNPAAERLFGYPASEVMGQRPAWLPEQDRRGISELMSAAANGGASKLAEYEFEWTRPDGSIIPAAVTVSPILDGDTVKGISVFGQDITERRHAASALETARAEAMESSRLKSEFLATMSHEIRTPMNGVIGLTSLLLVTELDALQRQYAEGVHTAGEALLTLINDILDFSKLEAGKVLLDPSDFDLRKMVEQVGALLAPAAFGKRLELIAYCLPDVPQSVYGDEGRIRQVVLNLASNAVKFTAAGEVAVCVKNVTADDDSVRLRFGVTDTGIGIGTRDRQRLFESFSQADTSTTRRFGGTGLGLAISSRLVEAMDGEIGLESELGVGSTFWFEVTLPIGAPMVGSTEPPDPGLLTDRRVLVVDDNATNRTILAAQLGSWNVQADLVEDALTALRQLRLMAGKGQPYDVAVLDMVMPDVDGLQLARIISADPALRGLQMIMLTSSLPPDPAVLRLAGIRQWLSKPLRSSDLYDKLVLLLATQPEVEATRQANRPATAGSPTSRGRVLVVEDNTLNQLVAEGVVSRLGYQVHSVANGLEALHATAAMDYSAILMDCHMPVMDGFTATDEIRRREMPGRHTPIIAMTAAALIDDRRRCLAAGMDDYVSKPIDAVTLGTVLAKWVLEDDRLTPEDDASTPEDDLLTPEDDLVLELPTDRLAGELVLDRSRLADLSELQTPDGSSLLSSIVAAFIGRSHDRLNALRQAVRVGNDADLLAAAHEMKGASGTLGAGRVAALCRELEMSTDADTPALRNRLLDELEGELAEATHQLTHYMAVHA